MSQPATCLLLHQLCMSLINNFEIEGTEEINTKIVQVGRPGGLQIMYL